MYSICMYSYLHLVDFYGTVNVGKYISPMDPVGLGSHHQPANSAKLLFPQGRFHALAFLFAAACQHGGRLLGGLGKFAASSKF